MRRKDREMPGEFAWEVADKCEWAVLSLVSPQGEPYSVPVTIAREGDSVYFHSAMEGTKTDCMRAHKRVCLVCVGDTRIEPDKFTTKYESAVLKGTAAEVTDEQEKIHALRLICERHTPSNMAGFDSAIEKSLGVTAIWRIDVDEITGKCKK